MLSVLYAVADRRTTSPYSTSLHYCLSSQHVLNSGTATPLFIITHCTASCLHYYTCWTDTLLPLSPRLVSLITDESHPLHRYTHTLIHSQHLHFWRTLALITWRIVKSTFIDTSHILYRISSLLVYDNTCLCRWKNSRLLTHHYPVTTLDHYPHQRVIRRS